MNRLSGSALAVPTANASGYRYGVSDQAFYIPVILRAVDPAAFPRDASLIVAQGHLMVSDQAVAALMRLTGVPLPFIFLAGYLVSLALIWIGISIAMISVGLRIYAVNKNKPADTLFED